MRQILFAAWISILFKPLYSIMRIRDYNEVHFHHYETFDEFASDYLHNQGEVQNRLNQNLFLGVATPDCMDYLTENPIFLGEQKHAPKDIIGVAILSADEFPHRINECAQIMFYYVGDILERPSSMTNNFEVRALHRWSFENVRFNDMQFTNGFSFKIQLFWMEESATPVPQGYIMPGKTRVLNTFIGHTFSASAAEPNPYTNMTDDNGHAAYNEVVDYMVVDGNSYTFHPSNRLETCELTPGEKAFIERNELDCENMFLRLEEFTHKIWHVKRMGLNFVQPQLVRSYSPLGFELRRLPEETYHWLKNWYDEQQKIQEVIESSAGPCMNQLVAPSAITHLTPEYKNRLEIELKPIMEEWYGEGELELTSIYGVRKYINGSVLRMHVDTVVSHVVSAIINVDQEVDKDWPLLILDHEDNEHNIVMSPGDMVLYESAKSLHGRPETFVGKHYDNIFIHFRPVKDWDYQWL